MASKSSSNKKIQVQPTPQTSACLCGGVSLTVTGVDKGTVLCHCSNCKIYTGSAFAHNYRFTNASVDVTRGSDLIATYRDNATTSGNCNVRHFCGKCGSSLYAQPEGFKGLVILPTGAAKVSAQPVFELYPEDKYAWVGQLTSKPSKL